MADIIVIMGFLLALAAAPEIGRFLPAARPRWVARAWWRTNAFRPGETNRPQPELSEDERAAAENHDVCRAGEDS
ncbi:MULTISPECIES: hypothetical protein [unclassified Rhodococcus (in: high G+C Gram-positive bacteria)]|uniref:hypothetical protein n=1 Tax=unclassified Rhodococcus (in: high G+C Gram-positive bacteria) TaxID=192944 RepID=UPI00146CB5E6|nr:MULTISPECIES: hypothetical protein [unclassified Rhodococcus (in: high G+C Gram-positive bacteria)]MBF0662979.1 hypothetical protein [Rhodococcus sp. (in: high G+C Gram-positive bacteria)]NMD94907.1 hypothetical protein [Rhodococcus sp. BL-253-APC-6A1W]NME78709.1 hypothetical protein [Rhodococcus sp. 105337]